MRPIPPNLREEMAQDPFYKRCALSGVKWEIEWHHNLIFAGRQINEKWCIIPLTKKIHDKIHLYKERVDWIMLNRASIEELRRYSKAVDLIRRKEMLNNKFGIWTP